MSLPSPACAAKAPSRLAAAWTWSLVSGQLSEARQHPPPLKKVEERMRGCLKPSATAEIKVGSGTGGLTLRPSVQDSVVLTRQEVKPGPPAFKLTPGVVAS